MPPLPHHILLLLGTRPELVKLAMVFRALQNTPVRVTVGFGGQHLEVLEGLAPSFGVRVDWRGVQVPQGTGLAGVLGQSVRAFGQAVAVHKPDLILGQGDTVTALAAGLAAGRAGVGFGHVEAGLRSGDLDAPWPEEGYRRMISRLASWHFAPTRLAKQNLLAQGIPTPHIWVTGNTVIDALQNVQASRPGAWPRALGPSTPFVLWTLHRRENLSGQRAPRGPPGA